MCGSCGLETPDTYNSNALVQRAEFLPNMPILQVCQPLARFRLTDLFLLTAIVAVCFWAYRAYRAFYETFGMSAVGILFIACVAVICVAPLMAWSRFRRPICIGILAALLCFCVAMVPAQRRLDALANEVARIVSFVDSSKLVQGSYPPDLAAYPFARPDLASYIRYELRSERTRSYYLIHWNPTGEINYGHCYSPELGHWFEDD
jgi:hypothetical protein